MSDAQSPENDAPRWVRLVVRMTDWWDKPRMCLYCGETPCGCVEDYR